MRFHGASSATMRSAWLTMTTFCDLWEILETNATSGDVLHERTAASWMVFSLNWLGSGSFLGLKLRRERVIFNNFKSMSITTSRGFLDIVLKSLDVYWTSLSLILFEVWHILGLLFYSVRIQDNGEFFAAHHSAKVGWKPRAFTLLSTPSSNFHLNFIYSLGINSGHYGVA